MIRIAIIDDHQMFVDGISGILSDEDGIELLGVAKTDVECLNLLKSNKVDLLLNDIQIGSIDGISFCRRVKKLYPATKVLMLTMFTEPSIVRSALKAKADGYLIKSSGKDELLKAINLLCEGEQYIDEEVQSALAHGKNTVRKTLIPRLSRREKEVLKLIVEEHTTNEIASILFVSPKTIESHRSNLLAKFDVRNIAGLVRKTIEYDINFVV